MDKKIKKLIKYTIDNYGITSDNQLLDLSKKLDIKINYIGFIENLKSVKPNGGYIINLGDTNGTHWTAFYKENDKIFYFDSFASPFEDKLIKLSEKSGVKNIIYNDYFQVQDINDDYCGIWVLLFLYYMTHSKKKELIDRFKEFIKNYKDIDGDYSSGSILNF